jgi:hypothetical protein
VLPVGIGACTDTDEGGNEYGKSGEGGDQKFVHTCLLITLAVIAALNPGGVVVVVISAGGFEVLTQPSHSLAENSLGPVAWLLTFFCRIRLPRTHTHTDQMSRWFPSVQGIV